MIKQGLPKGTKTGMGMCDALAPREKMTDKKWFNSPNSPANVVERYEGKANIPETVQRMIDSSGGGESGISIFDPVLCEIVYRWFSPEFGSVLDPFAGGSVRGIVASKLKRQYIGVELRQEQVDANVAQGNSLCEDFKPVWLCDTSMNITKIIAQEVDLVFSCPPYADLEVYSDDPRDISNMSYDKFLSFYENIINQSVSKLKNNRFACFVVGEVREKKGGGFYRGFVPDTIRAFEKAGARLYNEAILITSAGSLPIRAARPFLAARKLGKTHQNVLVFCKGDPVKATEACGEVGVTDALAGVAGGEQVQNYGEILGLDGSI